MRLTRQEPDPVPNRTERLGEARAQPHAPFRIVPVEQHDLAVGIPLKNPFQKAIHLRMDLEDVLRQEIERARLAQSEVRPPLERRRPFRPGVGKGQPAEANQFFAVVGIGGLRLRRLAA